MIDIALKEWSIVCDLIVQGRVAIALRKGGVHEEAGPGRFKLEHDRFALFPAWEHENLDWIKPGFLIREEPIEGEPSEIALPGYAEVAKIWVVPSRAVFDALDDLHCWAKPQIDMRFNYKPERPLYLMALRAYRLPVPKVIPNRRAFAGCKSWVPLPPEDCVDPSGATAALDDAAMAALIGRVDAVFGVER